jgi:hypothetical protein
LKLPEEARTKFATCVFRPTASGEHGSGKQGDDVRIRKFQEFNRNIIAALLAALLLAPMGSALQSAQAKPPRHAPAWGYRAKNYKSKKYKKSKRNRISRRSQKSYNRNYNRFDWDNSWSSKNRSKRRSKRRYRIFYRTHHDRRGNSYKQYYRVYR